jgi:hypothetical protein
MWDWLALLLLLRLLELLLPAMLLSGVPIADGDEMNFVCRCVPEVEAIGDDEAELCSCVPEVEAIGEDEDEADALALLLDGSEAFTFFRTFSSESVPLSGAFLLSYAIKNSYPRCPKCNVLS